MDFHTTRLLTPDVKGCVKKGVLAAEFPGRNFGFGFGFAENTDYLFVGNRFFIGMSSCGF